MIQTDGVWMSDDGNWRWSPELRTWLHEPDGLPVVPAPAKAAASPATVSLIVGGVLGWIAALVCWRFGWWPFDGQEQGFDALVANWR